MTNQRNKRKHFIHNYLTKFIPTYKIMYFLHQEYNPSLCYFMMVTCLKIKYVIF